MRTFLILIFLSAWIMVFAGDQIARDSDCDYETPVPGGYKLPAVKTAADGALLDSNGKAISLHDLTHGRITVLSFIYTGFRADRLSKEI